MIKEGASLGDGTNPLRILTAKLSDRAMLSKTDHQAVLALPYSVTSMRDGVHIVRAGQTPAFCTLLLSGFAQRYRLVSAGARQIVGFHMEGDFVDLHYAMLRRADQSVQLITPAKIAEIPAGAVFELMRSRPAVAEAIWMDTLADASVAREWLVNIGRRDARARVAHLLCELAIKQEHAGLGSRSRIDLFLTQEQIGDALGLTSVHVNRTLKSLEAEGAIQRDRPAIIIPDWNQLADIAGFSSAYLHLPSA